MFVQEIHCFRSQVVPLYGKGKTGDGAKTRPAAPAQNRGVR